MTKYYKKGYPRPQLVRDSFYSLNGEWSFRFDPENEGIKQGWKNGFEDRKILVPFAYESKASGIGREESCHVVWYSRIMQWEVQDGKRLLLNFEGVDYRTEVWVNGVYIGVHEGGYSRFTFDITDAIKSEVNMVVCRVEDSLSCCQLRGKQRWMSQNYQCWYTQTTGIWKDVWAEQVDCCYVKKVYLTPVYEDDSLKIEYELELPLSVSKKAEQLELETVVTFQDKVVYSGRNTVIRDSVSQTVSLRSEALEWKVVYWSTESPNLYDICIRLLENGHIVDEVGSYFGFRKISTDTGRVEINNIDFYLKMVLDQGYWVDTLLTPPNEEAIIFDIKKILAYGYNGVRKHQKIESDSFYYWADVLGLAVWCEAPSFYEFDRQSIENSSREWSEIVKQHYNHPSIIAWVLFNESWGISRVYNNREQQAFTESIYYLTKSLDPTRPAISNDGWEHTKSDIITLHDYAECGEEFLSHWKDPKGNLDGSHSFNGERYAIAKGFRYEGQPIIISEYGGIAYGKEKDAWGYGSEETSEESYLTRLKNLTDAIKSLDFFSGYCYTQLTDVQQEQNGLMDMKRNDKISVQKIREIFDGKVYSE